MPGGLTLGFAMHLVLPVLSRSKIAEVLHKSPYKTPGAARRGLFNKSFVLATAVHVDDYDDSSSSNNNKIMILK